MTARQKAPPAFWDCLLRLANNDNALLAAAAESATDEHGRMCYRQIQRNIMRSTNPALLATMDAATEFMGYLKMRGKARDLPRLSEIYSMAVENNATPKRVFNHAALLVNHGVALDCALGTAINECRTQPSMALH